MSYGLLYFLIISAGGVLSSIPHLRHLAGFYILAMTVISVSKALISVSQDKEKEEKEKKNFMEELSPIFKEYLQTLKKVLLALSVLFLIEGFIPKKKDLLIITGLHLSTQTINEAIEIPKGLITLINKELKELGVSDVVSKVKDEGGDIEVLLPVVK